MQKLQADGINATDKWFWVYFTDTTLIVPRRRAVQVSWGLVVPEYQRICDGINHELARRVEAEARATQLPLPLEVWE